MRANPHRLTVKQLKADYGVETEEQWVALLRTFILDGVCPALCDEGCVVEPDGRCPHDCPSVLVALGMI